MFIRKIFTAAIAAIFLFSTLAPVEAAAPTTVQEKLSSIEKDTYGQAQTGALMDRINKLERDYDSAHRSGSMMSRVDALYDEIYMNDSAPSVLAQLNAIEWNVNHEVSMDPVDKRVVDLESLLNGKNSGGGNYKNRITALSNAAFGEDSEPLSQVTVGANTLIKIALVTPVNARHIKVGDTVKYKVAEDVVVDGHLVFAKGLPGEGTVTKVKQARNFGRNAEVVVDFKKTKAIDGTYVDTFVGEESKKEMKNLAMAAGASLAGMLLLGPIGIIAGAFVKGKNVDLPEGTEVIIQTKSETPVYGVQASSDL